MDSEGSRGGDLVLLSDEKVAMGLWRKNKPIKIMLIIGEILVGWTDFLV